MAITFPNSPSSGDTHTTSNGLQYTYDGEKWTTIGTNSAGTWTRTGTTVSLTTAGDDLNVDSGTLFVDASTNNVGVGTSSPDGKLTLPATASNTPALRLQSASSNTDVALSSYADANGTYAALGANYYLNSGGNGAAFDTSEFSAAILLDGRNSGSIQFLTSSSGTASERMRIDSSGNLGLGTSSPGKNVDIVFSDPRLRLSSNASNNATIELLSNAKTSFIYSQNTGDLNLQGNNNVVILSNGGSEAMRLDSSGRLGLGTSSPSGRLTIKDGGYRQGIVLERAASTVDRGFIYIGDGTNSTVADEIYLDASNTAFHFRQGATGTTETVTFKADGKVGVGTSSPNAALTVHGSAGNAKIRLGQGGDHTIIGPDASGHTIINAGTAGGTMNFETAGTERMRINSSGRVGIGTSSPGGKLDVAASGSTTLAKFSNPGVATVYFGISGQSTNYYDANTQIFRAGNSITERLRIDSSGRLLVGTSTTTGGTGHCIVYDESGLGALTVKNTNTTAGASVASFSTATNSTATTNSLIKFFVNGFGAGSGSIVANGTSQAAFATYSDRRLKENIVELPSQLENIKNLRPVEFDYIEGGHQIGFIAQEFQDVYPDAIGLAPSEKNPEEERLTITGWSKTEAYLVKALQEAIAKIETLEQRLSDAGIA